MNFIQYKCEVFDTVVFNFVKLFFLVVFSNIFFWLLSFFHSLICSSIGFCIAGVAKLRFPLCKELNS